MRCRQTTHTTIFGRFSPIQFAAAFALDSVNQHTSCSHTYCVSLVVLILLSHCLFCDCEHFAIISHRLGRLYLYLFFFFFSYKSHEHFRYPKQKKNTIHFLFVLLNSSHCNTILDLSIYICVCVLHCSNGLVCVFIFFFTCCATLFCEFLCCFRHMIFFTLFICPVRVHVPLM